MNLSSPYRLTSLMEERRALPGERPGQSTSLLRVKLVGSAASTDTVERLRF